MGCFSEISDVNNNAIPLPSNIKEIYILCVVSDRYPALANQVRHLLKYETQDSILPPLVIDVFTLDVITEMLDSPLFLLSYLNRRACYSENIFAEKERVVFAYHLRKNLWLQSDIRGSILSDDWTDELDIAMLSRRCGIPGNKTPPGILTLYESCTIGRILKQIERSDNPKVIDFGFCLLTLNEDTIISLSKSIDENARHSREDGQCHDITLCFGNPTEGITIHCSAAPREHAYLELSEHSKMRKYIHKANRWHGICLHPKDLSIRFGLTMEYEWCQDSNMDALVSPSFKNKPNVRMRTLTKPGVKLGRNDPCPCGSGKKYKKCCLVNRL